MTFSIKERKLKTHCNFFGSIICLNITYYEAYPIFEALDKLIMSGPVAGIDHGSDPEDSEYVRIGFPNS